MKALGRMWCVTTHSRTDNWADEAYFKITKLYPEDIEIVGRVLEGARALVREQIQTILKEGKHV